MDIVDKNVAAAGLGSWDEDDILAEVMARSQQEYLDSLKKNVGGSLPATVTSDSMPSTSTHGYTDMPSLS